MKFIRSILEAVQRILFNSGIQDSVFRWEDLVVHDPHWKNIITSTQPGTKVLLPVSLWEPQFTNLYSVLCVALRLRGADVCVVINDGVLPASEKNEINIRKKKLSRFESDAKKLIKLFTPIASSVILYSECISSEQLALIQREVKEINLDTITLYAPDGIAVGEHALAGALRYFAKGTLENEPDADRVLRLYLEAALITKRVTETIIQRYEPEVGVFHHGIYIPFGIIGEVLRSKNIHVVNWNVAYRKKCFIFSHRETYHHSLLSEPTNHWEDMNWNQELDDKITNYLKSRRNGSEDWISFNRHPEDSRLNIISELGIDTSKTQIALLTNVIWDAQLHYKTNIFSNMIEWVMDTIEYFSTRSDLQLLIRIHPAECKGTIPSRQRMVDEITKRFPRLPDNIIVIPPESSLSTYVIGELCDAAIIYGTKTGVELTSLGIPTIVAGEAWVKHKGITQDPSTIQEYHSILDNLPQKERLSNDIQQRAKQYAYHFFFRRMIPIASIKPSHDINFRLNVSAVDELIPGKDVGLDVICNGILKQSEFIYPDETMTTHKENSSNSTWLDLR